MGHSPVIYIYLCSSSLRGGVPGYNEVNERATNSLYEDGEHQWREERDNLPHTQSRLQEFGGNTIVSGNGGEEMYSNRLI